MNLSPVIETIEQDGSRFAANCAQALKDMLAGKKNPESIKESVEQWARKKYHKEIADMLDRWNSGSLFNAQRQSFDTWIAYKPQMPRESFGSEENPRDDRERYYRLEELYSVCGERVPDDIKWFWSRRIAEGRGKWNNPKERDLNLNIWSKENIKWGWNWNN